MEMEPASKGDWGQIDPQQVSFVSGYEEHIYDDKEENMTCGPGNKTLIY